MYSLVKPYKKKMRLKEKQNKKEEKRRKTRKYRNSKYTKNKFWQRYLAIVQVFPVFMLFSQLQMMLNIAIYSIEIKITTTKTTKNK